MPVTSGENNLERVQSLRSSFFYCEVLYYIKHALTRPGTVLSLQSEDQQVTSIKMNTFLVVCFLGVAAVALARPDGDFYTDKYDNVDLDEILSNQRLLQPYVKCTLDQGKCTADAKELKEHIVEALENECKKCNETQRKGTERVIKHLINKEPGYWKELTEKYDPERKYVTKYEKKLKEIQA